MRQLRYHRSTIDPNKLKRPWVLFNKLTFLIPFVAHVVDKSNNENYSEQTNGCTADNKIPLQDYLLSKLQPENYYECEGTEIHDLTMDLNADTTGEEEETSQQNQSQPQHDGYSSNRKKQKFNSSSGLDQLANDRKSFDAGSRHDTLDEHDHFLYSLAPELRKIDSKYTLHFRNEVHNLIMKYQSMSSNEE